MFLVIGPLASLGGSWLTSFSPSSKRFVLKSASSNGERSETLKVELTLYSPGKSIFNNNAYKIDLPGGRTYIILTWQVNLVCIVVDLLNYLKRPISSWLQLVFPLQRKSLLSKMHPNPISFLKLDIFPTFVSRISIGFIPSFNSFLGFFMQLLY